MKMQRSTSRKELGKSNSNNEINFGFGPSNLQKKRSFDELDGVLPRPEEISISKDYNLSEITQDEVVQCPITSANNAQTLDNVKYRLVDPSMPNKSRKILYFEDDDDVDFLQASYLLFVIFPSFFLNC